MLENSDFLTIHNAFASWRRACANGQSQARKLCKEAFLSHQVCLSRVRRPCLLMRFLSEFAADRRVAAAVPWVRLRFVLRACLTTHARASYLVDSSFLQVDDAFVRELSRYVLLHDVGLSDLTLAIEHGTVEGAPTPGLSPYLPRVMCIAGTYTS